MGDRVRVLSRAENHLESQEHHRAITHEAEASAQRGQWAAVIGHILLITPLSTANQVRPGGSMLCGLSGLDLLSTQGTCHATFYDFY